MDSRRHVLSGCQRRFYDRCHQRFRSLYPRSLLHPQDALGHDGTVEASRVANTQSDVCVNDAIRPGNDRGNGGPDASAQIVAGLDSPSLSGKGMKANQRREGGIAEEQNLVGLRVLARCQVEDLDLIGGQATVVIGDDAGEAVIGRERETVGLVDEVPAFRRSVACPETRWVVVSRNKGSPSASVALARTELMGKTCVLEALVRERTPVETGAWLPASGRRVAVRWPWDRRQRWSLLR